MTALRRAASRWPLSPFWTAQLLGWATYGASKYALAATMYPSAWRVALLIGIGVALTLPLRALYQSLRRRGVGLPATLLVAVVASLVLANLWLLLYDGLLHALAVLPFEGWETYRKGVVNKAPVLLAWSALYLGIQHWQELQAERERSLRATALATEAQLEMLRYQLQPHFLFNALNSLRALIAEDPPRAREMVTELADFLRYSLLSTGAAEVTLGDEVESLRRYLALERVRYEERLQVEFAVEPSAQLRRVPSFLLHPLAENAVKYGIRTSPCPLRVTIAARAAGPSLVVEVANTGRWCEPMADPVQNGLGVGLENVRQRLARLYPGRHRFQVGQEDGWVRARIEIADGAVP
jgi:two-component system, LytTR family, sensor kinase